MSFIAQAQHNAIYLIILYMPFQILDGMGVDQNGNMPLVESNDVEIVYEAAASDEVEVS